MAISNLLLQFEGPVPDLAYLALARAITGLGADEEVEREYLVGRLIELLGYCARHTPWLVQHSNAYWAAAVSSYRRVFAALRSDADEYSMHFIAAKIELRQGRQLVDPETEGILEHSLRAQPIDLDRQRHRIEKRDHLARATTLFNRASSLRSNSSEQRRLADAHELIARQSLFELDAGQEISAVAERSVVRVKQQLTESTTGCDASAIVPTIADEVRSLRAEVNSRVQEAPYVTAEGRGLDATFVRFARARLDSTIAAMLETICSRLNELLKFLARSPAFGEMRSVLSESITELRKEQRDLATSASKVLSEIGLKIRSHSQLLHSDLWFVDGLLVDLDVSFVAAWNQERALVCAASAKSRITDQSPSSNFGSAVDSATFRSALLSIAGRIGASGTLSLLPTGPATTFIIKQHDLEREKPAVMQDEAGSRFIVWNNEAGLHIQSVSSIYSLSDPTQVHEVASTATMISEVAASALKRIGSSRAIARETYKQTMLSLERSVDGQPGSGTGPALKVLATMLRAMIETDSARDSNIPMETSLNDKMIYAWTMLEMFEVRTSKIRAGTLLSGRCSLDMLCPNTNRIIRIGADPLFKSVFRFALRGTQRDLASQYFHMKTIKVIESTLDNLSRALHDEFLYLTQTPIQAHDPDAIADELDVLLQRLEVHGKLLLAIKHFSSIFMTYDQVHVTLSAVDEAAKHVDQAMGLAITVCTVPKRHKSHLVNAKALEWFKKYLQAVLWSMAGMKSREVQAKANQKWKHLFQDAIESLEERLEELRSGAIPHCYLMPLQGDARDLTISYLRARIATTKGWFAWYQAQDASPTDGSRGMLSASGEFATAKEIYGRDCRDQRSATLAEAREIETRVRAHELSNMHNIDIRVREDWERAYALYFAVNDRRGLSRVADALVPYRTEYSRAEVLESIGWRGHDDEVSDRIIVKLRKQLPEDLKRPTEQQRGVGQFELVIRSLVLAAVSMRSNPPVFTSGSASEKSYERDFHDRVLRAGLLKPSEYTLKSELGGGISDARALGLVIEFKLYVDGVWPIPDAERRGVLQTLAYAAATNARVGFLVSFVQIDGDLPSIEEAAEMRRGDHGTVIFCLDVAVPRTLPSKL